MSLQDVCTSHSIRVFAQLLSLFLIILRYWSKFANPVDRTTNVDESDHKADIFTNHPSLKSYLSTVQKDHFERLHRIL